MRSRDYTNEIGVSSAKQRVPTPFTVGVFALVVVTGLLFVRQVGAAGHVPAVPDETAPVKISSR